MPSEKIKNLLLLSEPEGFSINTAVYVLFSDIVTPISGAKEYKINSIYGGNIFSISYYQGQ